MPATIEPSKEQAAAVTDRRRTEMREQLIAMRREEAAAEDDDDFAWFEDARTQLLPGAPPRPATLSAEPT